MADGATEPVGQFRSEYTSSDGQQQLVCEGGICGHLLYHLVRDSDNRLQCWDGLKLKVSLQSVNLDKNKFEILISIFHKPLTEACQWVLRNHPWMLSFHLKIFSFKKTSHYIK